MLPILLSSRKYIDMSSDDRYAINFEQLLRWIYDKPTFVMPALGEMPEFLKDDAIVSPTRTKAKRAAKSTRNTPHRLPARSTPILISLVKVLEDFRIRPDNSDFPQATFDSIDAFLPYRDEFIQFMFAAAPTSTSALAQVLQRFFERAIPFMSRPYLRQFLENMGFRQFRVYRPRIVSLRQRHSLAIRQGSKFLPNCSICVFTYRMTRNQTKLCGRFL